MQFRIADSFTDSLTRLTRDEQKAVKNAAFDLQMNPANPGLRFHRIERAKDKNLWSVRVSQDIRIIVHKTDADLLLCYVGHHDDAYGWAERRRIERHPRTGAAQLVRIRETVKEITIPKYVEVEEPALPKPPLFEDFDEDDLLGCGVPSEWLDDVRGATEDTLFDLIEHLPGEAAEALVDLATGERPRILEPVAAGAPEEFVAAEAPPVAAPLAEKNPFDHPDAQRRFRVVTSLEELERALEYPWEKWTVFLHPEQRELVERSFSGPARVAGSAGTGKTIVALHRAVHLTRTHPSANVLLTTFSPTLAHALSVKLNRLAGNEPDVIDRIGVRSMDAVGLELYSASFGTPKLADEDTIRQLVHDASAAVGGHRFSDRFLELEWADVVDAWQLRDWEAYRDVKRLGRKKRLGENQRRLLWGIFERVRTGLDEQGLLTMPGVFDRVTARLADTEEPPLDFVVVDEAQDVSVPQLRFLAQLVEGDRLFFAGDLGQRIFQTPFSWKSLGVDFRGRSHILRINYRTSHQIRRQADRLLPDMIADVDGNAESRRGAMSVFNGPQPIVAVLESEDAESEAVSTWLTDRIAEPTEPHEVGVIVRSPGQVARARRAVEAAGHTGVLLSGTVEPEPGRISICTMHAAKGLEFRAVAVMACDDEIVPLQQRVESVADEGDLEEVYNTERHLLYVACTRARDHLLVSGVDPASEFLDDLASSSGACGPP
jgi:superfamily I DNA/RNA helicase/mRNA-degrading endonuclease RelE of RelBE toxin-antitoxin system